MGGDLNMYEFYEENMKYRCIATEDRKHFILVNHTREEMEEFAKEHGFQLAENPEEKLYVVHESTDPTLFMLAVSSLTRRLAPLEPSGKMFPWFYHTKDRKLIAKGVYVGTGEDIPFVEVPEGVEIRQLQMPNAQ